MAASAGQGGLALLEVPGELRAHGFDSAQICHFQLPSRESGYLHELSSAFAEAEVTLETFLIDAGDLTHPDTADAQESWISGWIDEAEILGATRTRVIAGQQETSADRLRESARRLTRLARQHSGMRIVTENWLDLLSGPEAVLALFAELGDTVGLLIDLANWTGPTKYHDLAAIAPLAETCHAKAHAIDGGATIDANDFRRSLEILRDADFAGCCALVFDGPERDAWEGLADESAVLASVFASVSPSRSAV
ncbi:TIM barrel protein [Microbacteriaceae bacterium VKM Ac-2855]|nr:TIM barrel protein [Microbacteriaceae bacterium VKM Ac-2855]